MFGYLAVILGSAIFGTAGLYVKVLPLSVIAILAFRLAVPLLVGMTLRPRVFKDIFVERPKALIIVSILVTIRNLLWILGFSLIDMSKAIIVHYTWPLFTTILSIIYLKEKTSKTQLGLIIISFLSVILIFFGSGKSINSNDIAGLLSMLAVAITHSIVITILKDQLKEKDPYEVLVYDNFIGGILGICYLPFIIPAITVQTFFFSTLYGFTIGFLGYFLVYYGLQKTKASIVANLSYIEVFVSSLLGILILNEEITSSLIIGGIIILLSSWIITRVERT